ncbi:hypothetical protein G6514_001931 [Epicoccum nigrum]|nr:hypothetical protein G6514_001931 [Epicoccum nigrum]
MTSDSDSDLAYEQGSSNTENPALADIFSLDLLISRVEEMQKRGQLELLQKLSIDNSHLQHLVVALAFWGVEQGDGKACSYRPAGWI